MSQILCGSTIEEEKEADRVFLNNMVRILENGTKNRLLKRQRMRRAYAYYHVVKNFGGPFSWGRRIVNLEGEIGDERMAM